MIKFLPTLLDLVKQVLNFQLMANLHDGFHNKIFKLLFSFVVKLRCTMQLPCGMNMLKVGQIAIKIKNGKIHDATSNIATVD